MLIYINTTDSVKNREYYERRFTMKKIIALLLVISAISFCFVGCKSDEEKALEALEDLAEEMEDLY